LQQATGAPQPAAAPKRTPKRKPAAAALHSAGSWRGGEAEQEPPQFSPGLDALAAAGSSALAQARRPAMNHHRLHTLAASQLGDGLIACLLLMPSGPAWRCFQCLQELAHA